MKNCFSVSARGKQSRQNAIEVDSMKYYRATAIMLFDDGIGNNAENYDTFYDYCCGDLGADLFDYWYNNSDYKSMDDIHDMTRSIERAVNTMIYEIENESQKGDLMIVYELSREQLTELKQNYYSDFFDGKLTWNKQACIDEFISDEDMFAIYGNTDFVNDDFAVSAGQ